MDKKSLVCNGTPPNHCCCDTALRFLPSGDMAVIFMTGGGFEPEKANHVRISRSNDGGETWDEPDVVIQFAHQAVLLSEVYVRNQRPPQNKNVTQRRAEARARTPSFGAEMMNHESHERRENLGKINPGLCRTIRWVDHGTEGVQRTPASLRMPSAAGAASEAAPASEAGHHGH